MKRFLMPIMFLVFLICFSFLGNIFHGTFNNQLIFLSCVWGFLLAGSTEDNFYLFIFCAFLLEYFSTVPFGFFSTIALIVFFVSEFLKEEIYSEDNTWYLNLVINIVFWLLLDLLSTLIILALRILNLSISFDLIVFSGLLNYSLNLLIVSFFTIFFYKIARMIFDFVSPVKLKL